MSTARKLVLAGLAIAAAAWVLFKEPDSSTLRAELTARSKSEGLALACFYSIPASLTIFGQSQPVYLRTDRFGFAGVSPDGKHFFVNGWSLGHPQTDQFSGLEDLTGRPILAIPHESVSKAYRYEVAPNLQRVALCRYGEAVELLDLSAAATPKTAIIDERLRRADYVTWSPTGSQIAFEYGGEIHVYSLADGLSRRIAAGRRPTWSPDGSWIAFRSAESDAMIIKPGEDRARRIIAGRIANGFSWSPDSQYLLFGRKYRFQVPLGPLGYLGAYRLRDGARCKVEECSFKGMCAPESYSWVSDYRQVVRRFPRQ
jgi:hypothetical protein